MVATHNSVHVIGETNLDPCFKFSVPLLMICCFSTCVYACVQLSISNLRLNQGWTKANV